MKNKIQLFDDNKVLSSNLFNKIPQISLYKSVNVSGITLLSSKYWIIIFTCHYQIVGIFIVIK
jgi:hypothetical protein